MTGHKMNETESFRSRSEKGIFFEAQLATVLPAGARAVKILQEPTELTEEEQWQCGQGQRRSSVSSVPSCSEKDRFSGGAATFLPVVILSVPEFRFSV
jgi:hypothetical protein